MTGEVIKRKRGESKNERRNEKKSEGWRDGADKEGEGEGTTPGDTDEMEGGSRLRGERRWRRRMRGCEDVTETSKRERERKHGRAEGETGEMDRMPLRAAREEEGE